MATIARRTYPFEGEVTESPYEEGRYFIAGNEIAETLKLMQRDVFAFVADSDQVVTVRLRIEAGPEDAVDNVGVSGVAQFVGVPLHNAVTMEEKKRRGVREESLSFTGKLVEIGIGVFYIVQANGNEVNVSGQCSAALYRAIDDYTKARVYISCILDLSIEDAAEVIGA